MKKNAFTLIEMIATIGLLGMLATITITVSVRKINETKEKARDAMIQSIELAATKYANENEIEELNNYDNVYITLQTLVEKEYFTESLVDPTTKKNIPLTNEIYITREENGKIKSYYNINQRKEPKLTLIGSYNEYIEVGKEYTEPGIIAINPNKEDVSSNVTITGNVDTTTPNTYKITYELDNSKIKRNVIVYETNLSSKEFYKLIVDLDGGTDTVDYNTKYAAGSKINLTEPTKEGYIFVGWTISGTGANIKENILTIGKTLTKVTAKWEEKIITVSFKEDSWETIVKAVENGKYPYKVGDTKTIDLGSLGEHIIRVANTTPCEGLKITSQSACGFVLEFADVITTHVMNNSSTNAGGWPATEMRKYLNDIDTNSDEDGVIYNELPEELRNGIINTYVVSSHGSKDNGTIGVNKNFDSTDKLYLLSTYEVWGIKIGDYDTAATNDITRQLDYYATYEGEGYTGVSNKNYEGAIKNNSSGIADNWWLRSANSRYGNGFCNVGTDGNWGSIGSINNYGVSPAFRIAE